MTSKLLITIIVLIIENYSLNADPVTYDYSSTCQSACASAGLAFGDEVTGIIEFESDLFDGYNRTNAVTAFTFTMGDLVFTMDNTEGFMVKVNMDSDFTTLGYEIKMGKSITKESRDDLLVISDSPKYRGLNGASTEGYCSDSTCNGFQLYHPFGLEMGELTYRSASVPEPATWLVLVGGLVALFLNRRGGIA